MKEQLYTIPLMDAFRSGDECPFCFIHKNLEQHAIDFTLGSGASYMEDDIRAQTDRAGFCKEHYRQMFVYGNRLGSALIMETHLKSLSKGLQEEMNRFRPTKNNTPALIRRLRKPKAADGETPAGSLTTWIRSRTSSCFICEQIENSYQRYLATFIELFKRSDPEFDSLVREGKGYCLPHFADLLDAAASALHEKEMQKLTQILFPQMEASLARIEEDVDWFQKKFDYRFKDEDWKNAKDAVQRAMQKAGSGYPADPPYKQE